jgi:hypothetical protein
MQNYPMTQQVISEVAVELDESLHPDKDIYQLCEDCKHVVVRRYRDYGAVDCWKWGYETKDIAIMELSEIPEDIRSRLFE